MSRLNKFLSYWIIIKFTTPVILCFRRHETRKLKKYKYVIFGDHTLTSASDLTPGMSSEFRL